jgi:ribonuclease HII
MGSRISSRPLDTPSIIMGVDEAGRGPLFGPVYAAAVVLNQTVDPLTEKIKDSKLFHTSNALVSANRRVYSNAAAVGVGLATVEEIDLLNIRKATHLAMHRAIANAFDSNQSLRPDDTTLLVDGNDFTPYSKPQCGSLMSVKHECVVKGDSKIPAISAASIVAKVARDKEVNRLCDDNPTYHEIYGLRRNKGYGTVQHIAAIKEHGITAHHRRTFRPCSLVVSMNTTKTSDK